MIYRTLSTSTVLWIACASKLPLGQERQHQNLYLCGLNDDEATKKYPSKAVFKCVCLPERVVERGIFSGQNGVQVSSNGLELYLYLSHIKLGQLSNEFLVQRRPAGLATERSQVHTMCWLLHYNNQHNSQQAIYSSKRLYIWGKNLGKH